MGILNIVTYIPLLGAVVLLFLPKQSGAAIRYTATFFAVADFIASLRNRALAAFGTSEWLVMPGEVFISSRKGLRSAARIMRSARPQPRQPSER